MKCGDVVTVTYGGNTIRAQVMLASPNGASLMLGFDGILTTRSGGGYLGSMPVLRDALGVFRDLVANEPVLLEPLPPSAAPEQFIGT